MADSRKRAVHSAPIARKAPRVDAGPDPWKALSPLGDKATRTATALAELAVQTVHTPETWLAQNNVAEAATHEILHAHQDAWKTGVAHGKWLLTQEVELSRAREACTQSRLCDLQLRFDVLQAQYEEAAATITRSALRSLTNFQAS